MSTSTFSMSDLMDLLVAKVGLPVASRTDDPNLTFTDLGLDSLAYLQLQTELSEGFGVSEEATGAVDDHVLGELVALVNEAKVAA